MSPRATVPLFAVASLLAGGCPGSQLQPTPSPTGDWASPQLASHPLVGNIWSVRERRFVPREELVLALPEARVLLLGERHDNPDHHRLQAWTLRLWLKAHPGATVGFEMLDEEQAAALAAVTSKDPDDVATAVAWDDSGWPSFEMYRPVFQVALDAGARLQASHPAKGTIRTAMAEGIGTLPPGRSAAALLLNPPLSEPQQAALEDQIRRSHCGHAPESRVASMALAQRIKDAWMALRLAEAGTEAAALVTGGQHVRRDRGVPMYLARRKLGPVLVVTFEEVAEDEEDPAQYDASADFIWFTPAIDLDDPCDKYREMLKKMSRERPKSR